MTLEDLSTEPVNTIENNLLTTKLGKPVRLTHMSGSGCTLKTREKVLTPSLAKSSNMSESSLKPKLAQKSSHPCPKILWKGQS